MKALAIAGLGAGMAMVSSTVRAARLMGATGERSWPGIGPRKRLSPNNASISGEMCSVAVNPVK